MRTPSLRKESDVIKRLRSYAASSLPGLVSFKIHSGIYSGNIGFPDLIFLWGGRALFLEAKSGSKLTSNQGATIKQMRHTKTNVWIVRPVMFPMFLFKTILPDTAKILEVEYDVTSQATWLDIFEGPDRELSKFIGKASIAAGELS